MKVLPFNIPKPTNAAILHQVDKGFLYQSLHNHEEVQISAILEGSGTLFIGDTFHSFSAGDLFVIGGYQPHVFNSDAHCEMHSVFFSRQALGMTFLALEEGVGIEDFYAFAKAGLKTTLTSNIKTLFDLISAHSGMQRLGHFIALISVLREVRSDVLSTFAKDHHITEKDGKRMRAIFDFTFSNYQTAITLAQLASVTAMTPHSFCKFFKQRTHKTYFKFLTEVRIAKATALLERDSDLSIAEIANRSGFKTLSHFNKCFKQHQKVTPSIYRQVPTTQ